MRRVWWLLLIAGAMCAFVAGAWLVAGGRAPAFVRLVRSMSSSANQTVFGTIIRRNNASIEVELGGASRIYAIKPTTSIVQEFQPQKGTQAQITPGTKVMVVIGRDGQSVQSIGITPINH